MFFYELVAEVIGSKSGWKRHILTLHKQDSATNETTHPVMIVSTFTQHSGGPILPLFGVRCPQNECGYRCCGNGQKLGLLKYNQSADIP